MFFGLMSAAEKTASLFAIYSFYNTVHDTVFDLEDTCALHFPCGDLQGPRHHLNGPSLTANNSQFAANEASTSYSQRPDLLPQNLPVARAEHAPWAMGTQATQAFIPLRHCSSSPRLSGHLASRPHNAPRCCERMGPRVAYCLHDAVQVSPTRGNKPRRAAVPGKGRFRLPNGW